MFCEGEEICSCGEFPALLRATTIGGNCKNVRIAQEIQVAHLGRIFGSTLLYEFRHALFSSEIVLTYRCCGTQLST